MPTDAQLEYIRNLYDQLGQEPELDIEDLTVNQASDRIGELKALVDKRKHEGEYQWSDWLEK
jgi:hypothetical protein